MITRRNYLKGGFLAATGALLSRAIRAQAPHEGHEMPASIAPPVAPKRGAVNGYTPVVTPNGTTLPWVMKHGVKEFHLIAEPVVREFALRLDVPVTEVLDRCAAEGIGGGYPLGRDYPEH